MENEYKPAQNPSAPEEYALPNLPKEEEFDISHFDFTIHDPGEEPAPAPAPEQVSDPVPPAPPSAPPRRRAQAPRKAKAPPSAGTGEERRSRLGLPVFGTMDREMLLRKGKRYLRYALRPSELYENIGESLWWLFLTGACLFGGLFYLSVAMDWSHADLITAGRMWGVVLTGLLLGGTVTLAFALGTSLLARLCKEDAVNPLRVISSVAGAAVCPAAVLCIGIFLGLFGLSVSMSFGMIALLWWILSLMEVLKDLMGDRYVPILTWIILWGIGLFALISLTFSLK